MKYEMIKEKKNVHRKHTIFFFWRKNTIEVEISLSLSTAYLIVTPLKQSRIMSRVGY